jgi:hypothetical protein
MGWLFGALGGAGITIPKTFDLSGIVDLVLQVLGLTYRNIRARVVRIVGEPLMQRMEQTVDVFKTLVSEGVGGLWRWIKDRVGDLEDLVLGQIKTFIIEKVIKAGVVWLIAFLNPAAAFIKACKMIVDVITFLIERGSEIMSFVSSILDSVGAIAKGAIGIVAEKVESSLAKALPLAISFLASLLGLGGISEKIHQVIDKVRGPINKAVDFVVMGAVKGARKLFGKVRGTYEKGKKWVKGKVQGAKDWASGIKDRATGKKKDEPEPEQPGAEHKPEDDERTDGQKQEAVQAAVKEVEDTRKATAGDQEAVAKQKMTEVKSKYRLKKIELVDDGKGKHHVEAEINPRARGATFGFGPPKETEWGPLHNECGTWMLTYIVPGQDKLEGQDPKAWPSWWAGVKPTENRWWVRGHLLNNKTLGGPGDFKNLTPITKTCNRRHESVVESLVKNAMTTHKMLCYFVDTSYGKGPTLVEDRAKNPDKSCWTDLTDGLYCHWEFIDEDGNVETKGQTVIENEHK